MSSFQSRTSKTQLRRSKKVEEVTLRIMRASEDTQLCTQMLDGYKNVLRAYGIKNLSSLNTNWIGREDVILIAVVSVDGERVLAGTRLQSGPSPEDFPFFQGIGKMDDGIRPWLESIIPEGLMEVNGMWNSAELAGMGLGVEWMVQSAMASMSMLNLRHILALTSPVTRRMRDKMGWSIRDEFGDKGYFKYPNDKLRASIEHFVFPDDMPKVHPEVRTFLDEIWADPIGHIINLEGPKSKLRVRFNISI